MEFQTTIHEYWKNTICASEAALGLLSAFESMEYAMIDDAIKPLRRLVGHGRDFEKMRAYKPPPSQIQPTTIKTHRPAIQVDYDQLEPGWDRLDDNTVRVSVDNGEYITAIKVTTEQQLESIVPEIEKSDCIAIDCEFLSVKKEMPVLKLLQIAVSKEKGYAIQVDLIGQEAVTRHLKPILENEKINAVGWAYRADAMAIECYFKQIELAPVLDLQAKLKPIAVEQLSLHNAMIKFASNWKGLQAFTNVKHLRNAFNYSAEDCIWTKDPLPAKAMVYAIFDVVSLIALNEYTAEHPTETDYFWPYSVTNASGRKALDRWHRQRAIGKSSPSGNQDLLTVIDPQKKNLSETQVSSSATSNDYDDSNPDFQRQLQEAIKRSLVEAATPTVKTTNEDEPAQVSDVTSNWHENDAEDTELCEKNDWMSELSEKKTDIHFAAPPTIKHEQPSVVPDSWDSNETEHHSSPRSKSRVSSSEDSIWARSSQRYTNFQKSPRFGHSSQSYQSGNRHQSPRFGNNNNYNYNNQKTRQYSSNQRSPSVNSPSSGSSRKTFQSKPTKDIYSTELKTGNANQSGEFSWDQSKAAERAEESWKEFADKSQVLWEKKIDIDPKEIDTQPPSSSPNPQAPRQAQKFNTVAISYNNNNNEWSTTLETTNKGQSSSWEMEEERPRSMKMPMNQIPIRQRFSGPKVNNPDDLDDDDDDDDDNNTETATHLTEDLPTFVDTAYLIDSPYTLYMHKCNMPEHLQMIAIPEKDYTVAITYYKISTESRASLKALQLLIATDESADSYTIVLDQACLYPATLKDTKLGILLSNPDTKRLIWYGEQLYSDIEKQLGLTMGASQEVSSILKEGNVSKFNEAVNYYLKDWKDYDQFKEKQKARQGVQERKFSNSLWDEKNLRPAVLEYSAFSGLALYKLYEYATKLNR
ncbi:hypothetical protein G6F70_002959 [Rhizopus microsporus]|nr:hypothetical protein G6F71_000123 [Rhizopus microsporus]KAG1201667.1 hypothetical protein G6F70_002959 [Rhizopus microsporus]KAG1213653.1 hypothetical protein G6F69_002618 [Rhizopus microsporus]KAG1238459.1 hypothetical protein G6F67_000443 [Rhizopus microsporus]KAG1265086.1 hypothetical protein G6F68_003859 [Rhizopus microsporus]